MAQQATISYTTLSTVRPPKRSPLHHKPRFGLRPDPGHWMMEGLRGWWLLNEGKGETAYDLSPYRHHGTWGGTTYPHYAANRRNWAGAFDYTTGNDEIDVGDVSTLDLQGAVTLSCWLYARSFISWQYPIAHAADNYFSGYQMEVGASGDLYARIGNGTERLTIQL